MYKNFKISGTENEKEMNRFIHLFNDLSSGKVDVIYKDYDYTLESIENIELEIIIGSVGVRVTKSIPIFDISGEEVEIFSNLEGKYIELLKGIIKEHL